MCRVCCSSVFLKTTKISCRLTSTTYRQYWPMQQRSMRSNSRTKLDIRVQPLAALLAAGSSESSIHTTRTVRRTSQGSFLCYLPFASVIKTSRSTCLVEYPPAFLSA